MKKFLLLVLTLFLSTTVVLAGCNNKGLKDNPAEDAPITSNGGMAVRKGDYLYYVNGFKSYEGLTKGTDNLWDKQVIGAIYRVKVTNNTIAHNEDGFVENTECVVPQIVGTENASFYIFGNYIYYATPNMQNDEYGNLLNARSNICRININGTGNDVLYTTDQTLTASNWTMYEVDGTTYAVIVDGEKIVTINGNDKKPQPVVLVSNAKSVGLIKTDKQLSTDVNYGNNAKVDGVNNYIYYTRDITEDDNLGTLGGNVLARVKVNEEGEQLVATNGNTYTIEETKNNCLYYSKTVSGSSNSTFNKYELSSTATFNETKETEILNATYTKKFVLDANNSDYIGNDVVVIDGSNNIKLISVVGNTKTTKTIYTGTASITGVRLYGSRLFFIENSVICYIDVTAETPEVKTVQTDGKTIKVDVNTCVDYDGRNVYFYSAYTPKDATEANYYLNRTDLEASEVKSEFVGEFAENHTPAEPEEDEDNTDPENQEIWIK